MLKTVFKKKKYLPFVENWEGAEEFPRKEQVLIHNTCVNFDSTYGK